MRGLSSRWVLSLAALSMPGLAQASAFPQPAGQGRVIVSAIFSNSDKAFDADGNVVDIADYRKTEIYLNGEYGLTDDLTLILTPSFRDIDIEGGPDTNGLNFIEAGARYRIASSGSTNFSLQGTVRIPGEQSRDFFAQTGRMGTEIDLRGTLGTSFGQGGFFEAEAGYRFRTDDPPNEFHADFALGVRPAPKFLLLANSFNTFSDGSGRGVFTHYRYHNLFLSGVYDVSDHVSLQLGGMGTLGGENALRERGLLAGLWFRF